MFTILQMTFSCSIMIHILLKFVPKSQILNNSSVVQVMAWSWTGDKPLPDPMLTQVHDTMGHHKFTRNYIPQCNYLPMPQIPMFAHKSPNVWRHLTHWGRDKMAAISQTTFSNAFSWMKMYEFHLRFHWNLFLRFELTIFQHWFR